MVQEQIQLETRQSSTAFRQEVRDVIESLDLDKQRGMWDKYKEKIASNDGVDHLDLHLRVLDSVKKNPLDAALLEVVVAYYTSKSGYLERNVLADKVGKKVTNRKKLQGTELQKSAWKFSVGLSVLNFLHVVMLLENKVHYSDGKKHVMTVFNPKDVLGLTNHIKLYNRSKELRTGSPMLVQPLSHMGQEGGYLTSPQSMLSGSGLNTIKTQKVSAIDKLQNVAYRLRDDIDLEGYDKDARWYSFDLETNTKTFMTNEWDKLMHDLDFFRDKDIFFPHAFDARGRVYDRGHYLKLQGDSTQKSMFEFANKEKLNPLGVIAMKLAIVAELHDDKLTNKEALNWFEENKDNLKPVTKAGKVLVNDWSKHLRGEAIGTIVHRDATNSGLQIYSVLGRDARGAMLCNLNNLDVADAYMVLVKPLGIDLEKWGKYNVREALKKAFMTYLYGAGESIMDNTSHKGKYTLREIIGDNFKQFENTLYAIAPAAVQLRNLIYKFHTNASESWTLPDGFVVNVHDVETLEEKGYYMSFDGNTHQGTFNSKQLLFNKGSKSLAPNVIHSIDAYVLREVVRRADFDIQVIHDSFGVHPNNAMKLTTLYKEVLADILESNLLEDIFISLNPRLAKVTTYNKGGLTREDIMNSPYALK